jgi:beta-glucanase (GH16 family)
MNRNKIFITALIILFCITKSYGQTPLTDLNWQPYFTEDFSAPINWNKWQLPSGNWQPLREFWTTNNVIVSGGNANFLVDEFQSGKYHVGGIETKNTSFPYGYYEIKWQVPQNIGRWVSWWLCCGIITSNSWEELDFYENNDIASNSMIVSNIHSTGVGCNYPTLFNKVGNDMTQTQNILGVEWTPNVLIFYFNNQPIKEIFYDGCIPYGRQNKLYITPGISKNINPNLSLPSTTTVDYVKVWTLKKNLVNVSITNNSQLASFTYNLKKSISINGQLNSISIPIGQKSTFRATDNINIDGEFNVPLGAEITLFTHNEPNN